MNREKYTDWVVNPKTGEICPVKDWENNRRECVPLPYEFTAFIKSDSACHGLEGKYVGLRFDELNEDGLWFIAIEPQLPFCIPDCDINFMTMGYDKEDEDCFVIPPIPTIAQLQNCLIDFVDNITSVTYITDNAEMYLGQAKCHPDDKFDILTGIAIAYDRAIKQYEGQNVIKVGDKVVITDPGENYPAHENKLLEIYEKYSSPLWMIRFAYGDCLSDSTEKFNTYTVLYIDENYALIEDPITDKCRLIGIEGIAKKEG